MINKKYILFDLDGTLTDPYEGITKSLQYALKHFGIEEPQKNLRKFIGPPFKEAFLEYYKFDEKKIEQIVAKYRERFSEKGLYENELYKGIPELLKALKDNGKKIALASSKPGEFAEIILKYFNIYDYFDFLGASNFKGERNTKSKVIGYTLEQMGISDVSEVVMVGDRKHDVIGAKDFKIETIGVLYGFGGREELETAGAEYICESVEDLKALLIG